MLGHRHAASSVHLQSPFDRQTLVVRTSTPPEPQDQFRLRNRQLDGRIQGGTATRQFRVQPLGLIDGPWISIQQKHIAGNRGFNQGIRGCIIDQFTTQDRRRRTSNRGIRTGRQCGAKQRAGGRRFAAQSARQKGSLGPFTGTRWSEQNDPHLPIQRRARIMLSESSGRILMNPS